MDKYGYSGAEKFRPLSPWAYVGYSLLFSVPLIGFILLIVFAFSDKNVNRRSYARSWFCAALLAALLLLVFWLLAAAGILRSDPQVLNGLFRALPRY